MHSEGPSQGALARATLPFLNLGEGHGSAWLSSSSGLLGRFSDIASRDYDGGAEITDRGPAKLPLK